MEPQKTILLTGATGFLGSHLLEAFLRNNYKVVVLKRTTSNTWRIGHLLTRVIHYNVDEQPIESAFRDQHIDYVIHTACNYGRNGEMISEIVQTNLLFGLQILDACICFNTDTFFNVSTLLPEQVSTYAMSKKHFADYLKQNSNKIKVVNLKIEHMYGPHDDSNKFIPWILKQFENNTQEIKLTEGMQLRDFIYISDVVSAFKCILENICKSIRYTEFDVGTGELVSVKDFLIELKKQYELEFGTTTTKLLFGKIPYRKGEEMEVIVNNQPLKSLGWKSHYSIHSGIQNYLTTLK
jgi:CDP-paratose synthetase